MPPDDQDPKGRIGRAKVGKPQRQTAARAKFALETPGEAQFNARQERAGLVRKKGLPLGEGEPSADRTALEAAENATPPTDCDEGE